MSEAKKQTSIGRLKTVTKPNGESFNVLEITQDIELKMNDTIYLNDYTENVDFLVKKGLIDAIAGAERKANAVKTNPSGVVTETRFTAMLQLDKRGEKAALGKKSANRF